MGAKVAFSDWISLVKRIGRRRWVLAWFLLIGAVVYGIENMPVHDPAKTAASAVILLYGGYEVILDRIANRDTVRRAEQAEKKAAAVEAENAELRRIANQDTVRRAEQAEKKATAVEAENAELRRRIAELEQRGNGSK